MQPVRLVAEANAEATREMARQVEAAAEAMASAREGTHALAGTADRLRRLIAHFRLTEARREAVNIPVAVRSAKWAGTRAARIVDLSATGARINGLEALAGSEIQLTFSGSDGMRVQHRARVMRSAAGDGAPWIGIAFVDPPTEAARAA
jgi:hypothetical protein